MVEQNRLTAEAQWQQLAERWNGIFDREIARWKHVGLDVEYVHGVGEMRFQKDAEGIFQDAQRALQEMRETSDWRDIEKLPEYQNYLREMERIDSAADRAGDPDSLGWQAEQRFYNEQDPDSEWYREDLYHGEPGPDVALDRAEQYTREAARDTPPQVEPEQLPEGGHGYPSEEDAYQAYIDATEGPSPDTCLDKGNMTLRAQIDAYREGHGRQQDTPNQAHEHGMGY